MALMKKIKCNDAALASASYVKKILNNSMQKRETVMQEETKQQFEIVSAGNQMYPKTN